MFFCGLFGRFLLPEKMQNLENVVKLLCLRTARNQTYREKKTIMSQKSKSVPRAPAHAYSETEKAVLRDLFLRLPTLALAYSVRGASRQWCAWLDDSGGPFLPVLMARGAVLQRAAAEKCARDPFYTTDSLDQDYSAVAGASTTDAAHWRQCLPFLAAARLQWDCEALFRDYRRTSARPLARLSEFLNDRMRDNIDDEWTRELANNTHESLRAVEQRVLHDCNDRAAERHVFAVRREQARAAAAGVAAENSDF